MGRVLMLVTLAACGAASPLPPLDVRGVYHLTLSYEPTSEGAFVVAKRLEEALAGSGYLRVARQPSHHPLLPQRPTEAALHIDVQTRAEGDVYPDGRTRRGGLCRLDDDCLDRTPSSFYGTGTIWGSLELVLRRHAQQPQRRQLTDHTNRGDLDELYRRLSDRVQNLF